jgi:uncharacterized protein HemX
VREAQVAGSVPPRPLLSSVTAPEPCAKSPSQTAWARRSASAIVVVMALGAHVVTCYRRRREYGGRKASQAQRLKELERDNRLSHYHGRQTSAGAAHGQENDPDCQLVAHMVLWGSRPPRSAACASSSGMSSPWIDSI